MIEKLIIAIIVLVLLVSVFFITYILNKKTPIPEECQDLKIEASKCATCKNEMCSLRKKEEK